MSESKEDFFREQGKSFLQEHLNKQSMEENMKEAYKPLWQKVKELEESQRSFSDKEMTDYLQSKATMLFNFGPEGRNVKGIVSEEQRLTDMLIRTFEYLLDNQNKE